MAATTARASSSIRHAPEMTRADRLWLFEAMARSRGRRRRIAAERKRGQMPPLEGAASPGWEALEAAVSRALREGDALAAGAEWLTPMTRARRVGENCRLTDMVAAGLGATFGAAPGTAVVALAGPAWGMAETAAVRTAVERRAPLVVVVAAPEETARAMRGAAASCGVVFEQTTASEVEVTSLAVETACHAARAGQGPTLLAFVPDPPPTARRRWEPREPSADPIERFAARLRGLGVSAAEMRDAAQAASGGR